MTAQRMNLRPANAEVLAQCLRDASRSASHIERVDLSALSRILEHTPEDMTVTVEAGATLASLQRALADRGQWLPIDPPHPDRLTLAALLDTNASGPRRAGFGTLRDYVIGLRVAMADGRLIRSGGKVVKNVAGYDLMKLFIGARGTLGVIVEVSFKLLPLPESEAFVQARCDTLEAAERLIAAVLDSELMPAVFDLHNLGARVESERPVSSHPGLPLEPGRADLPVGLDAQQRVPTSVQAFNAATLQRFNPSTPTLILGFSGARAAVDWQLAQARSLGFTESATLDHDATFHAPDLPPPYRFSVLPSRLVETLRGLGGAPFVSRVMNGAIYHRGVPPPRQDLPRKLMDRVKATFDPTGVFPEYTL